MTQAELARELGVSRAYISMVLSGRKQPSKRMAERLTELVNSEANPVDPKSCSSASSDTPPGSEAGSYVKPCCELFTRKLRNALVDRIPHSCKDRLNVA